MENLKRVTAKIFASNANLETEDIGQFGSALAGNKLVTGDIETIQALPAFEQGWRGAVLSTRNYPPLPEMAGLQKVLSYQGAYLLQKGIPEWDANTTYYANTSFCQVDGRIYQSLTDDNIGNNPTSDITNWQYIDFNGLAKEVGYNNVGGCILEAPNGVLQVENSGKTIRVPKGLKCLMADGRNPDRTLNGFEVTNPQDMTFNIPSGSTTQYVFFLALQTDKETFSLGYRELYTQFFEQAETPILPQNECTWLNTNDNTWYEINSITNSWQKTYRCKLAYAWVKNGVVTQIKTFQPLRALTYTDRLTNLNAVDWTMPQSVPYNTVFTAPMDGKLFVSTGVSVFSNVTMPDRNSFAEIRGLIGNKVSVQNVTSGGTVTKTLSAEYTSPGTYTINVPAAGYYTVWLVGGGGTGGLGAGVTNNGQTYRNGGSGGSGAGFVGELYLTAGNHTVNVGGFSGASSIDNLIVANGGTNGGGNTGLYANGYAGAGGTLSVTGQTRNVSLQANGNAGNAFTGDASNSQNVNGGASVYLGWGAGGASNGSPATGYFKLYGTYQEGATSTEIVTEGAICYEHYNGIVWDGEGNTVSNTGRTSNIIPISKGEQFILYTHSSRNNPSISNIINFYPAALNTNEDL